MKTIWERWDIKIGLKLKSVYGKQYIVTYGGNESNGQGDYYHVINIENGYLEYSGYPDSLAEQLTNDNILPRD